MIATIDSPSRSGPARDRAAGRTGPWLSLVWRERRIRLPAHWPFSAMVIGFPLWWALGFGPFSTIVFAIPMAMQLRRIQPVRVPRGFGWWAMFMLAVLVGGLMLGSTAPDTVPDTVGGQIVAYSVRFLSYLSAAVLLLYMGNLGERGLPERVILKSLVVLFVVTVLGGLLGLLAPSFEFTSPLEAILPRGLAQNGYVQTLVHPSSAQIQNVLGYSAPRPKAPFEYTNTWGNVLGILVVWVVAWAFRGRSRRMFAVVAIAVAAVPIVVSLNRGLWIGLALAVLVAIVRLVLSGRLFAVLGIAAIGGLLVVGFTASPLEAVVAERLANPHSDDIRSNLADAAVKGAKESPIVGWGTTREVLGSFQSIAVGASSNCTGRCGNPAIGSTGLFWLILFAHGFVGIALYLGFFLAILWYYRGDRTPVGIAAQITLLMSFWFMFIYSSTGWPLTLCIIAAAVLWRHKEEAA